MRKLILLGFLLNFTLFLFSQITIESPEVAFSGGSIQPLIVGHRGGFESNMPENSIPMFDFTFSKVRRKPIAVEFDIRESKSGTLYIMHDITVNRTTDGAGNINELTDKYINTLFLKDRNGKLTTQKVPRFTDVLQHFQNKNIVLMLDVKGKIYPKVINLVNERQMESKCIMLTFSRENTKLVKEITTKIMISALVLNQANWDTLQKFQIPSSQLIAYISKETPQNVIDQIYRSKVLLMTDTSEGTTNNAKYYKPDEYMDVVSKQHLGILISDYPLYVSKLFSK